MKSVEETFFNKSWINIDRWRKGKGWRRIFFKKQLEKKRRRWKKRKEMEKT